MTQCHKNLFVDNSMRINKTDFKPLCFISPYISLAFAGMLNLRCKIDSGRFYVLLQLGTQSFLKIEIGRML